MNNIENLFCNHLFTQYDLNGNIECEKCNILAKDYYRRDFEDAKEFVFFLGAKILE